MNQFNRRKAIFLDRDGTIIVDKVYLNDPNAIEYLPGVFTALRELRDAGFIFLIVTNQSGIPRELVEIENLHEIHRRIRFEFARNGVDLIDFYYAPYLTDYDHPLRKPNPGMILEGASHYNVDLSKSWMIGDRMIDIEAGHRAGVKSILVGQREKPNMHPEYAPPEGIFATILDAVPMILGSSSAR